MQALIDQMRLGRVGLVDAETASKPGRLLLAKNIAWGEVDAPPGVGDDISVVSIVSETLSHKELGKTMLSRPKYEFFKLEKEIVTGIVNMLGLKKEDLAPSVAKSLQRIHTTNLEAFMYYGKGLDLLDQMNYDSAKEAFQKAFKLDPEFGLANEAYKFAPSSAVNAADLGLESRDIKTYETGATGNLIDTDITTKVIDVKQEQQKCP